MSNDRNIERVHLDGIGSGPIGTGRAPLDPRARDMQREHTTGAPASRARVETVLANWIEANELGADLEELRRMRAAVESRDYGLSFQLLAGVFSRKLAQENERTTPTSARSDAERIAQRAMMARAATEYLRGRDRK